MALVEITRCSSPVKFVHVTELAWDEWVYAQHMSKGDGRDNLFFEPDHVCPRPGSNHTVEVARVSRATSQVFPWLAGLGFRPWALPGEAGERALMSTACCFRVCCSACAREQTLLCRVPSISKVKLAPSCSLTK